MAQWLLRESHADWARAMRAEFCAACAEGHPSLRWAWGCLIAAAQLRCARTDHRYMVAVLAMLTVLIYVEWHADADTIVLTLLISSAAILGFSRPQRTRLTAVLVGESLLFAHVSTTAIGWWLPFYQFAPLGWDDWIIVASLGIPALVAALAGASFRRRIDSTGGVFI